MAKVVCFGSGMVRLNQDLKGLLVLDKFVKKKKPLKIKAVLTWSVEGCEENLVLLQVNIVAAVHRS